ncbi:MAG: hypothetical protein AAFP82_02385 [Bacteroidota bacterium]
MKTSQSTSFEDYLNAYYTYKEQEKKEEYAVEFQKVREAFEAEHGEIINQYTCNGYRTAALLSQKKRKNIFTPAETTFFTQYNLGSQPEIEKLLIEIDFLAAESSRSLRGEGLHRCLSIIYKVAKNVLTILDSMNKKQEYYVKDNAMIQQTVEVIKSNLEYTKKYHQKVIKFTTQKNYLLGNTLGFLIIASIVVGIGLWGKPSLETENNEYIIGLSCLIFYGLIGGGIGAIISVMNRISSGSLNLSTEPDPKTIRITGLIRPFIGGVFGALILILFNSGFSVFTLINESSETRVLANFVILSFIAGFFERFVPDILDQTKNKILAEEESVEILSPNAVVEAVIKEKKQG